MTVLNVCNLKKRFGKNEVLKGISFTLEKGEVLAIIGSSGGGKTTLLRCLNFLELADSGTISVCGDLIYDVESGLKHNEYSLRKNRLRFGLVFQSFNLFPQYNVFKNVTLAPSLLKRGTGAEIEQNARSIIERVGLSDKLESYPCELSGGQQQRVAIARALMLKPDVLCFDEPTSALDPELTGEVLSVIKNLKNGDSTMIIVTHEMEFARNVADRIMFIADGCIEEMGTPSEVFNNPKSPKMTAFINKSRNLG